jgi:chromosome partitioning protein
MEENLFAKMLLADAAAYLNMSLQLANKRIKDSGEAFFKSQQRIYFGHDAAKKIFNLKFKQKVVSFQIVKGGTGKTTIAFSFALRANLYGAKVLCIDLDQQGNLTQAFNIDPREIPVMIDVINNRARITDAICSVSPGLDIIPSRIENSVLDNHIMLGKENIARLYLSLIDKVRDNYDLIVIDCPPALGQSVAAATLASDVVLSVLTPEHFSLSGLYITQDEITSLAQKYDKNIEFKIVLNKFDTRTALSTEVLTMVLNDVRLKEQLCKSFVRVCQDFPNSISKGSNIFGDLKKSSAKEDVDLLTKELLELKLN